jgi:hypothetical protein
MITAGAAADRVASGTSAGNDVRRVSSESTGWLMSGRGRSHPLPTLADMRIAALVSLWDRPLPMLNGLQTPGRDWALTHES